MIILTGMCYSGKTTLGNLLARELSVPFLDSRDLFQRTHHMSETEFLTKYGRDKFCEAEVLSLFNVPSTGVLSLGGSACYHDEAMKKLKNDHTIVWLNVDFSEIVKRKEAEGKERPIVFPEGIDTFEELYNSRARLYPKHADLTFELHDAEQTCESVIRIVDMCRYINPRYV